MPVLVVLNAMDAAERGARILTHTRCESIARQGATWQASLRDRQGQNIKVTARCVVNAAGPWVAQFLEGAAQRSSSKSVRLVKGSHIVVKRLSQHDHAYIFQNPDGRIVFAIPYEKEFTLIGTTDVEYHGDTSKVSISAEEIDYLCTLSNRYFEKAITPADVVWSYAGVRPLLEDAAADASAVTRDYQLDFDVEGAPLLSVFGGKITTFRKLAEEAVDLIAPALANTQVSWTANACLPGGDIFDARPDNRSVREFDRFISNLQRDHAWLPAPLLARYARAYGSRTQQLLAGCKTDGKHGGRNPQWLVRRRGGLSDAAGMGQLRSRYFMASLQAGIAFASRQRRHSGQLDCRAQQRQIPGSQCGRRNRSGRGQQISTNAGNAGTGNTHHPVGHLFAGDDADDQAGGMQQCGGQNEAGAIQCRR